MKKTVLLISIVTLSEIGFAQDYETVQESVFFDRSPSFTQQSFESDIRLRSMGGVNLPIEDSSNAIGIFTYGGAAAGLPLDYRTGKQEFSYLHEQGKLEYSTPGGESDNFLNIFSGMSTFHKDYGSKGEGSFAVFGAIDNYESVLSNQIDQEIRNEYNPGYSNISIAYGHRIGNFLTGIKINREETIVSDLEIQGSFGFPPNSLTHKETEEKLEIEPSIGYVVKTGEDRELSFFGAARLSEVESEDIFTVDGDVALSEGDLDGILFRVGSIYHHGRSLQMALSYEDGKIDGGGDEKSITSSILTITHINIETKDPTLKARVYFRPINEPISFGASYTTHRLEEKFNWPFGLAALEQETKETTIGLGGAWHFNENRSLVGAEYNWLDNEISENINPTDPDFNEKQQGTQLSIGTEIGVSQMWSLRGGVRLKELGEDPVGPSRELEVKTTEINLGFEFRPTQVTSLNLAYANTKIEGESDEGEYNANSLNLVGKFLFGLPDTSQ